MCEITDRIAAQRQERRDRAADRLAEYDRQSKAAFTPPVKGPDPATFTPPVKGPDPSTFTPNLYISGPDFDDFDDLEELVYAERAALAALELIPNPSPPRTEKPPPVDSYVYAWYMRGHLLPFYIGKGIGNRAWVSHDGQVCQVLRDLMGDDFYWEISRDGMTPDEATAAEAVAIELFKPVGNVAGKHPRVLSGTDGPERYERSERDQHAQRVQLENMLKEAKTTTPVAKYGERAHCA